MKIFIALLNAVVLLLIALRLYKRHASLSKIYWQALSVKIIAGIFLGLLYLHYYHADDTFSFFEDGKIIADFGRHHVGAFFKFLWNTDDSVSFWGQLNFHQPRAFFLSKIVSVLCLITADNYWIISVYFSMISFACSWRLVNTVGEYFPKHKDAAVVSFLFIPSVVFWGSGLVKECLELAALFFLSHIFLRLWYKTRIGIVDGLLAFVFLWVLWQVKYYYLAVFIPIAGTSLLVKFFLSPLLKIKSFAFEILMWLLVLLFPLFLISLSRPNFHTDVFFSVIVKNYNAFQMLSNPGDAIQFNDLQANIWSILYNAPWALVSGLFRPFIWEAQNPLQRMASMENVFLLFLLVTSIKNWKAGVKSPDRLLILSLIVYVLMLCVFLTLSTPNYGTLSRYRVGFLPYLFFLVSINNSIIVSLTNFIQRSFVRLVP